MSLALHGQFLSIERELNQSHLERPDVVRSLLVALLARQHVILLGPPGTGKSRLVRDLCQRIVGRFFEWQLTRMSTPEEIFGPISLQGLQQDRYRRIATGKLPEAEIAYLDETFKASSAILNTLLAAMNERIFFNDGQAIPMPLEMLVGASNELPEDREELGALWDRFLIRHVVDYVKDPASFAALLQAPAHPAAQTTITLSDLKAAQQAVETVDVLGVLPLLGQLRTELAKLGVIASDRRWRQSVGIVQANAWMNGHTVADAGDVTILQHVLWDEPDQRLAVAKAVLTLISPFDQEAQDILDDAKDVYIKAVGAPPDAENDAHQYEAILQASQLLNTAGKRLGAIAKKAREAGKSTAQIRENMAQVQAWHHDIMVNHLGMKEEIEV
ncbi:AAA domain-containing protein [Sulfobacillus sp. DSM 109850]|uniref:AAA domain-containing protein n=1 Tax=Sulfobacillus harzensis TaxID=2729629 RepID=A0A7Y0Q515_9FIRM|nr:AAA domain-containing protein [Sulfobacillus harzensis]